ncbi:MAG: VOC family protein [Pseudomonadota bacterium]
MRIHALGHVVLKVRDLDRSAAFYRDVLGLKEVARYPNRRMAFFVISDNHHDIALIETDSAAPDAPQDAPGLAHVALKVGDSLDELRAAKSQLDQHGVSVERQVDHHVSKSLYFSDPDGNRLEFFVDNAERPWLEDPQLVATGKPLEL